MGFFDFFKRSRKQYTEEARRDFLLQNGRITDGTILDSETNEKGEEIAFYIYSVHGVDFESSEILSAEKVKNPLQYAPGAKVGVRFDPKNHGNSILM